MCEIENRRRLQGVKSPGQSYGRRLNPAGVKRPRRSGPYQATCNAGDCDARQVSAAALTPWSHRATQEAVDASAFATTNACNHAMGTILQSRHGIVAKKRGQSHEEKAEGNVINRCELVAKARKPAHTHTVSRCALTACEAAHRGTGIPPLTSL
jgi:hypothetical protein